MRFTHLPRLRSAGVCLLLTALCAGTTMASPADATGTTSGNTTRGAGVYVKRTYAHVVLNKKRVGDRVITIGPMSPGSYVVTWQARLDTYDIPSLSADITCGIFADHGDVEIITPMFRFPEDAYAPLGGSAAFTTYSAGSIAVRCAATDSGNAMPGVVAIDRPEIIVQRVSTVHSG